MIYNGRFVPMSKFMEDLLNQHDADEKRKLKQRKKGNIRKNPRQDIIDEY